MTPWTDGYISDVNYTHGFYRELTPTWLHFAALTRGVVPPPIDRPFNYCELGCGQGFGAALTAAAHPQGNFYAFDFNPAQIANAQRFAEAAGVSNIEFFEASFADLAASDDGAWPQFDFIVLHGIYSWVSRENQLALVKFAERFLKTGGLLYISYNCMPGWAGMVPLQRYMRQFALANPMASNRAALESIKRLLALQKGGARYLSSQPGLVERLKRAEKMNANYLAHEYLHAQWFIHHFADVADDMSTAKLSYIGSAHFPDNHRSLTVPKELQAEMDAITDPILYETTKDMACNQSFRRDIFQRGVQRLTVTELQSELGALAFPALRAHDNEKITFTTPLGTATGDPATYGPALTLAQTEPVRFERLVEAHKPKALQIGTAMEILSLLTSSGHLHPAGSDPSAPEDARNFNRAVARRIRDGHELSFFLAPAIGSGIGVSVIDALIFSLLDENPAHTDDSMLQPLRARLAAAGRRLLVEGKAPKDDAAEEAELRKQLAEFNAKKRPLWVRLGILATS